VGDLFEDYAVDRAYDEMFEAPERARPDYGPLRAALADLSPEDLWQRCAARDRSFRDQGITFSLSGEERPFPLDLVPRIIGAAEWAVVERGVVQRVRALEAFLADVYGPGRILEEGVVPRRLVVSSEHFLRQVAFVEPPNGVRVHVAGIDLVRGVDGRFVVLEDNLRVPSGVSYVVENRRTMAAVFPELFTTHRVRPVADYPARLYEALRRAAPVGVADPTVVVLTPGVHNSAYFEHTFLARQMGVELVEGRDLVCRDNVVRMRTTEGEQPVDVIYRRVDDDYIDPLHFRPNSLLGCAGLLNAARAGTVTLANAAGNGVADDKAVHPYVPAMIEYYLEEDPVLGTVPTYRLEVDAQRTEALDRLEELVWKPVNASGGHGLVIGPHAERAELGALRAQVEADPRGWIAQEVVTLSTSPTQIGERIEPRHVDLRPFAVNDGERIWVAPGGLTRVALPEGSLVVNSSQGGGSKDTWVLADPDASPERDLGVRHRTSTSASTSVATRGPAPPSGPADTWDDQQQQQQGPSC